MCLIFLLNDLACFSFRSAAAAYLVRAANNFPHRCCGGGTRPLANSFVTLQQSDSGRKKHIKSKAATKFGRQFFAQRVQHRLRRHDQWRVKGAALAVLGDRKGVILPIRIAPFHYAARCAAIAAKRSGHQDRVWHAGAFFGRLHAGHLRSCNDLRQA